MKTVTTPVEEHNRMMRYFNELTGNPVDQGLISNGSLNSLAPGGSESSGNITDKVKDAAKNAVNKVKGLFKKKK